MNQVVIQQASSLKPIAVSWLWNGWLAANKFHLLAGRPGTGKTTVAMSIAGTISAGGTFPDGTHSRQGNVLIWSSEDDPSDTLAPRLALAGADMERIGFISAIKNRSGNENIFDPSKDLYLLMNAIDNMNEKPKLLIIDPIVSVVAGNSNDNSTVRNGLQPLVDMGLKYGVAILGITHYAKGSGESPAVDRVIGSVAYSGVARVVWATAKRPEDKGGGRVLARVKSNIGKDNNGFVYDITAEPVEQYEGVVSTCVLWGEYLKGEADTLLKDDTGNRGDNAVEEAEHFLIDLLSKIPSRTLPQKEIQNIGNEQGFNYSSVKRAKKSLKIESVKVGATWSWVLPETLVVTSDEDQTLRLEVDSVDHLKEVVDFG